MEAWMIILGIALVRGVGAWLKRRNDRLEKSAPPAPERDAGSDTERQSFRIPGLNIEIPLPRPPTPQQQEESPSPQFPRSQPYEGGEDVVEEGEWASWETPPKAEPVAYAPQWQNSPAEEAQVYKFQAAGAELDRAEQESERKALLQRLGDATVAGSEATRPAGLDVDHAARPQASEAEHIHRPKLHANELLEILRSRDGIRHAFLLREVLGPPIALRGPRH